MTDILLVQACGIVMATTAYGSHNGHCGRNCISRKNNTHTGSHRGINRHEKGVESYSVDQQGEEVGI